MLDTIVIVCISVSVGVLDWAWRVVTSSEVLGTGIVVKVGPFDWAGTTVVKIENTHTKLLLVCVLIGTGVVLIGIGVMLVSFGVILTDADPVLEKVCVGRNVIKAAMGPTAPWPLGTSGRLGQISSL